MDSGYIRGHPGPPGLPTPWYRRLDLSLKPDIPRKAESSDLFPCFFPHPRFISMARTKKTQQGWNAKSADTNTQLKLEIESAFRDPARPNLRRRMAALQDLPMATTAISFNGSLNDWLNCCLSPAKPSPPVNSSPSTELIRSEPSTGAPGDSVRKIFTYTLCLAVTDFPTLIEHT